MRARSGWLAGLGALALAGPAWAFDCPSAPEPVLNLDYASRYAEDSETRSEIDPEAAQEVEDALAPVDDFLRDLTAMANDAIAGEGDREAAACVLGRVADWARAGALGDLGSETANLTLGSRVAGFGLVLMQVVPLAGEDEDAAVAIDWLTGLVWGQMAFWEQEAPDGARRGNLRAWAALGAAAAASLADDDAMRAWAVWSTSYVLCQAEADGSLPQEMKRGRLALRYQLHAVAPLVVATLVLDRQGVDLAGICDGALDRVAGFVAGDLATGERTQAITGEVQSYFDGSDQIEGFDLAWIEAYLRLGGTADRARLDALAAPFRPLAYSKLGGDQALLWDALR